MAKLPNEIWRDHSTDGVPSSGAHKPIKADIRDWANEVASSQRAKATTTVNYYVSPSGSNANDGKTIGAPFLTINRAMQALYLEVDCGGYPAIINLADGTYTAGVTFDGMPVGCPGITVLGNIASPSNVKIEVTSANALTAVNATLTVRGVRLKTTTGGVALFALNNGQIYFGNCVFDNCAASMVQASERSNCTQVGNCEIVGNAVSFLHSTSNSVVSLFPGGTTTLTGTRAFSAYFVGTAGNASIGIPSSHVFTGGATGMRYVVHKLSGLEVGSRDPETLPGSIPGVWDTGGEVVGRSIPGRRSVVEIVEHDANVNAVTTTTGRTVLKQILVPGGFLGANGFIEVETLWELTGATANAKYLIVSVGNTGNTPLFLLTTGAGILHDKRRISNVNNVAVQRSLPGDARPFERTNPAAMQNFAVNTANAFFIYIEALAAVAPETVRLVEYTVTATYRD